MAKMSITTKLSIPWWERLAEYSHTRGSPAFFPPFHFSCSPKATSGAHLTSQLASYANLTKAKLAQEKGMHGQKKGSELLACPAHLNLNFSLSYQFKVH